MSVSIVCRSFNPYSRIIQLVHIYCSCLTREPSERVLQEIFKFMGCDSNFFPHEVVHWIDVNHPEAYPYATAVIGFSGPWITTLQEVELILSQDPYLYQGRIEFVKEL